jgi:hypothetical protein
VVEHTAENRGIAASAGMALVYLASLSIVFAQEAERPSPLLLAVFAPAVLAGLLIRRFWALGLSVGVVAVFLMWFSVVDEDAPLVAMLGGLLLGIAAGRVAQRPIATGDAPAHRWGLVKRLMRRVVSKQTFEALDDLLDRLRFRIDTLPNGLYQPVRGLPVRASRTTGSESRWSAMLPVIQDQRVSSAVDIGACEGYFSLELAAVGIPTIAIESSPSNYRTALLAVRRNGARNVGVLAMEVTPENAFTLPAADCILCLSIWHHFVRSHGLGQATAMLESIWLQTRKVLFFDTGEIEMTPDYALPAMTPDPRSWLAAYLGQTCAGSRVQHLGAHRAFDPSGDPCERNLFAVIRAGEVSL